MKLALVKSRSVLAGSGFLRRASAIGLVNVSSKAVGFAREVLTARLFGASAAVDASVLGQNVYNLTAPLVADAVQMTALPALVRARGRGEDDLAALAQALLSWTAVVACVLTAATAALGPLILDWVTPFLEQSTRALTLDFLWLLVPYAVGVSTSSVFAAVLNAREHFGVPEAGLLLVNLVSVAALVALPPLVSGAALPLGLSLGFLASNGFLLWRCGVPLKLRFRHPALFEVMRPMPLLLIGYLGVQLNIAVDRHFASGLPTGSISALNYANKLLFLPLSVVVSAFGAIAFVRFSAMAASGADRKAVNRFTAKVCGLVVACLLPIALILFALAEPVVALLFERGAFDNRATEATAAALRYYATGMIAFGLVAALQRRLYAERRVAAVLAGSLGAVAVSVLVNVLAVPRLGLTGIALATSLSQWAFAAFLAAGLLWWRARDAEAGEAGRGP